LEAAAEDDDDEDDVVVVLTREKFLPAPEVRGGVISTGRFH
jgi:hypothetical protein